MDGPADRVSNRDLAIVGIPQLVDTQDYRHDYRQRLIVRHVTWSLFAQPVCLIASISLAVC